MLSTLRGSTSTWWRLPNTTCRTTPPKRAARARASLSAASISCSGTSQDSRKRRASGAVQLAGRQLQLLRTEQAGGHGGHRADHHRGHVVGHRARLLGHAPQQILRVGALTEVVEDLLQPLAAEDAVRGARLDQPVGEEAGGRAGRQRHGRLSQAGAHADADRRRRRGGDRHVRVGARHDRRGVAGRGVGERARLGIVDRQQHGGEVAAEAVVDHPARDLQRDARLEAGLEVGAQRVAHEGGAGERPATVAGDVTEDEADAPAGQGQRVVEVAAGAGAVGRTVGDRGA